MSRCKEQVPNDFGVGFHACQSRATMPSGYCRTHDPECIKARAAKRPPTKFEREVKMIEARQKIQREKDAELADLRAYKERTEAGLHKLSGMVDHCGDVTEDEMRAHGLWRDPPQAEVQKKEQGK